MDRCALPAMLALTVGRQSCSELSAMRQRMLACHRVSEGFSKVKNRFDDPLNDRVETATKNNVTAHRPIRLTILKKEIPKGNEGLAQGLAESIGRCHTYEEIAAFRKKHTIFAQQECT